MKHIGLALIFALLIAAAQPGSCQDMYLTAQVTSPHSGDQFSSSPYTYITVNCASTHTWHIENGGNTVRYVFNAGWYLQASGNNTSGVNLVQEVLVTDANGLSLTHTETSTLAARLWVADGTTTYQATGYTTADTCTPAVTYHPAQGTRGFVTDTVYFTVYGEG